MGSRFILIPSISKGGAERVAVNLLSLFDYIIVLDGRMIYQAVLICSYKELPQHYSQKAKLRARAFNLDKIMEEWTNLLKKWGLYNE